MCDVQRATEIDRLLPSPVSDRTTYRRNDNNGQTRRRRFLIGSAATLALVLVVFAITPSGGIRRSMQHYRPRAQRGSLQQLTEDALAGVLPSLARTNDDSARRHSHPNGKVHVISDKKHKHGAEIYHCTSQVMIMRHCDKDVKRKKHGKLVTTDMRDKKGVGHCSARGKERSEYIATLFVDPNDYQKLVKNKEVEDGIPPVPMIRSSLAKVSKSAASKKPQFPTPHKLYALSAARGKHGNHENFREIETITPLSDKFHLEMDDRFGVYEEGDLAADFFEHLSTSVTGDVNRRMGSPHSSDAASSTERSDVPSLCDNGMTVVNWKHSRIPALARALGCGKEEGCPKKYKGHDFDTMWLLTFQYTLLLVRGVGEMNVEASFLALESLSKESQDKSLRHTKEKHRGEGKWKITAELVNEGFDPNN